MHNLPWQSYQNLSLGSKMHDTQEKGYPATYSAVYCITTNTLAHTLARTHTRNTTHLGLKPCSDPCFSVSRNIK